MTISYLFTVLLMNFVVATCDAPESWQMGPQDPATPVMEGMIYFHNYLFFYIVLIAIFVCWYLTKIIISFNSESNEVSKKFTHSSLLEIVWTIFPAILLIIIAIPSFSLLYSLDEFVNPDLTLKVIGHQWYWSYEYSDVVQYGDFETIAFDSYMIPTGDLSEGTLRLLEVDNRVVLPVGSHIRLLVSAADVLHSWAVPSFGVKIDACPGRLSQVSLFIKRPGVFYGQCSEICGVNHGFMPIVVAGVDTPEFCEWLGAQLETDFSNLDIMDFDIPSTSSQSISLEVESTNPEQITVEGANNETLVSSEVESTNPEQTIVEDANNETLVSDEVTNNCESVVSSDVTETQEITSVSTKKSKPFRFWFEQEEFKFRLTSKEIKEDLLNTPKGQSIYVPLLAKEVGGAEAAIKIFGLTDRESFDFVYETFFKKLAKEASIANRSNSFVSYNFLSTSDTQDKCDFNWLQKEYISNDAIPLEQGMNRYLRILVEGTAPDVRFHDLISETFTKDTISNHFASAVDNENVIGDLFKKALEAEGDSYDFNKSFGPDDKDSGLPRSRTVLLTQMKAQMRSRNFLAQIHMLSDEHLTKEEAFARAAEQNKKLILSLERAFNDAKDLHNGKNK